MQTGEAEAPLCGLVLAGGLSARFGSDKAAAQIGGMSLLERAVRLLASCLGEVWVSVRAEQAADRLRSRFRCLADRHPGRGPAAGLEAAHAQAPDRAWLALACDQPGLSANEIRRLIAERDADCAATAFCNPGSGAPEPLCAIYEPATLAGLAEAVAAGAALSLRDYLGGRPLKLMPLEITNVNNYEQFRSFAHKTTPGRACGRE
ncbi:MAG: NTP transferase domain-containing protein [Gammaproteobacteria bacterium]|nr:NTP transferase domain-containing protein [Gammaproteobacteria bacterium]MCY4255629.1 NTP transferase domain-containing protein [Gammaproteobacteria bacterium]MCY4341590.1 NTP transferase domain-containing protein [Gammaproteobacteria bacterium]